MATTTEVVKPTRDAAIAPLRLSSLGATVIKEFASRAASGIKANFPARTSTATEDVKTAPTIVAETHAP